MAPQIPLNTFKLIAKTLDTGSNLIYQESVNNVSSIVLSSQITNITTASQHVTVKIQKSGSAEQFTLLKLATIPVNEALNPFAGKIVLEKNDALYYVLTGASGSLQTVLSILENANE
jgi:hypothetical protein